jgi:undecaprenyl diphosphate synthase
MKESDINEESILKFSQCPENNIDLLIRTGGDQRISNFLLYQIAYAEIIFLDKLWPDFTKLDLQDCIKKFSKVERRFGQRL